MTRISLEQLESVSGGAARKAPHAKRLHKLAGYGNTAMNVVNGVMAVAEVGQLAWSAVEALRHHDKDKATG